MTNTEQFLDLFETYVHRDGADKLLNYIQSKTDFFTAPASTRFHLNVKGGLLEHSLNVCNEMLKYEDEDKESLVVCGLLHDLCKANFYKESFRNAKNEETGQWEKVSYYQVNDTFPYGHGEKSVFIIERFMRLSIPEAMAIRWHMGGFDDAARGGSYAVSQAFEAYPLAIKLHLADLTATYLIEAQNKR